MIIRLVESDLHKLISSSVKKILRENRAINDILSKIVERLSVEELSSDIGENHIDIPLDDNSDMVACIDYEIEDNRSLVKGMQGDGYLQPDDPDEIRGDYQVYVSNITLDYNGQEMQVNDNGMVADALKNLIDPGTDDLEYYEDDDHSGWDERWK